MMTFLVIFGGKSLQITMSLYMLLYMSTDAGNKLILCVVIYLGIGTLICPALCQVIDRVKG